MSLRVKPRIPPRPYQIAALEAVAQTWRDFPDKGALIDMATGCHAKGQRILMFDGSVKAVENIAIGDRLMGPDSTPRSVLQLVRGRQEMAWIRPTKGDPWRVNVSHMLSLVRIPRSTYDPRPSRSSTEIVDVAVNDYEGWGKSAKHVHKLFRVAVNFPAGGILSIDPYLLGVLIGDGCTRGGQISICKPDEDLDADIRRGCALLGSDVVRLDGGNRCPIWKIKGGRVRAELERMGLNDKLSGDKFIPPEYKTASKSDRLAIIAGIIDTDGYLTAGTFDYLSKSEQLARDVAFVARSLGLAAYVRPCEKFCQTGAGGTYYRVIVSGDVDMIPCRIPRRQAGPRGQKKSVLRTGFTVERTGIEEEYYGFAIDGDRRYLLDDFTVTHNCGKTYSGLLIAVEECLELGGRVVWIAHREELISQPYQALVRSWPKYGLKAGIVQAGRNAPGAQCVFASMQTLAVPGRMAELLSIGPIDLIVVDEAHHAPSKAYAAVIEKLRATGAKLLGLTATAERADGKDLGDVFEVAFSMGIIDAIREGWLIEPYAVVHGVPELDLTQVGGRKDYDDAELGAMLLKAHIVEHTVAAMQSIHRAERLPWRDGTILAAPRGRRWLAFAATVEHARLTAGALKAAGWAAEYAHGGTPTTDRARILKEFSSGKLDILVNVGLFTEGTDLPICDGILLLRPTKSRPLFVQILGRGLRLHDPTWDLANGPMNAHHPAYKGKQNCFVIDLTGATRIHELISAPVLMGDAGCLKSPNRLHVWAGTDDGKAKCGYCKAKKSCYAAIEAGAPGNHEWNEHYRCRFCDRPQCPESPTLKHDWIPQPGLMRECLHCEASVSDPLSGVLRTQTAEPTDDTGLIRLTGLVPETWAVDLGDHGLLLISHVDGERKAPGSRWLPAWVPHRGRRPRPLADGPVEKRLAWALAKDVIRKARRAVDSRTGTELFGGQPTDAAREATREKARSLAIRLEIARAV